jgi:hypothetical protein
MSGIDQDRTAGGGPNPPNEETGGADDDQLLYAGTLAKGMYLGLGILLLTFTLYLTGIMQPGIPIEELPRLWTLSVHDYLEVVNHEFLHQPDVVSGWRWTGLLGMGDFVNFVGIAILAGVTVVCYARILPGLIRKKDWIYTTIAILEIIVLVLAAYGIGGGAH